MGRINTCALCYYFDSCNVVADNTICKDFERRDWGCRDED